MTKDVVDAACEEFNIEARFGVIRRRLDASEGVASGRDVVDELLLRVFRAAFDWDAAPSVREPRIRSNLRFLVSSAYDMIEASVCRERTLRDEWVSCPTLGILHAEWFQRVQGHVSSFASRSQEIPWRRLFGVLLARFKHEGGNPSVDLFNKLPIPLLSLSFSCVFDHDSLSTAKKARTGRSVAGGTAALSRSVTLFLS